MMLTELDKYRKLPQQTDDNKLEIHLELNNARYQKAYERMKELKQYTETPCRSIQTTTDVDRKNDLESFMKMMMIQQFQQQNLLYQSALLNTLTKEERAQYITHYLPYGNNMNSDERSEKKRLPLESRTITKHNQSMISYYALQTHDNASKLRIFGYIQLFALIIKQSINQPPFRLSKDTNFAFMLRYSAEYLAGSLKDINNEFGRKLQSLENKTTNQLNSLMSTKLDRNQQKTIKIELYDLFDCILIELTEKLTTKPLFAINKDSTSYSMLIKEQLYPKDYFTTLEKAHINLTEQGTLRIVTLFEVKILIIGLIFLRALITKLFLGFELGLSNEITQNKTSINNKLLGSICTYIYRKIMAEIISERTRTTDLPVPTELQSAIFSDNEMKEIYGMLGRRYLANFIGKYKRWLQDYCKALLTV
ncbi:hypothetical protein MN116_006491 [Schistosoma mekongi]|uniref:Uncharacterized protein n=1 Tax=Schistosoma mekongi TaxID=38744 RepID=A0AAE1ZCN5_SCHME|nr:hypothetical protein MN116_006491 [Schistosoma mekongi]